MNHRDDIQGLRAVAVLLVVLDHAGVSFLRGGYVGVDVFFVLSGFLITGILLAGAGKHGHVSFVDFYIRRARRILPAAALTLVATIVAAYYLLNYVRAKEAVWDSFWAAFFAANIRFAHEGTDYFAQGQPPSPVQHYWSLAVEEQFYLVWPALLSLTLFGVMRLRRSRAHRNSSGAEQSPWATRRLLIVLMLIVAASLAWSIYDTNRLPADAYFSTFTRAWELALGAALAVGAATVSRLPAASRALLGWLGLAAIGVAATTFSGSTPFPGYVALLPTVGTALVIAAGLGDRTPRLGVGRLLGVAPMRYIGDRSYSFYLWHWSVIVIAVLYVGHELSVGKKLILLLGAFAISIVTFRFFENPIRQTRWRPAFSAMLVPASVGAVVIVTLVTLGSINGKILHSERASAAVAPVTSSLAGSSTNAFRSRALPTVVAAVKAARRGAPIPSGLVPPVSKLLDSQYLYDFPPGCAPGDTQTTSQVCRLGDTASAKTIVVFGDSHAQMWMPAILAMAELDSWTVVPLVKSRCVVSAWIGHGYPGTQSAILRECHAWYRWAVRQAQRLRPDVTLMAGCCGAADGATADAAKAGYSSLAAAMKRFSKSVVLVADDDGIDKQPVDCLLARNATMRSCTTIQTTTRFAFNDDLGVLARKRNFGFLKTRDWFCFQYECPMVVGHTIVYRDLGHITKPYALILAAPFRAAFRRCILDACPR
jgi:peptidoglycan/LPS O-acetylase OafA/YrhL